MHKLLITDEVATGGHNSDLRDSHEYIQNQVWGDRVCTRQHSGSFVETRLMGTSSFASFDSVHPTYLKTICVLTTVAQIWVVGVWYWAHISLTISTIITQTISDLITWPYSDSDNHHGIGHNASPSSQTSKWLPEINTLMHHYSWVLVLPRHSLRRECYCTVFVTTYKP